jgi:hypothetical protein
MGLYSCKATVISRSSGRSAVAAAAYRSGAKLADERQGLVWDFTQKRGIDHSEILIPQNAPAWAKEREALWNAAELRETGHAKQNSAAVAREFRLALPFELSAEERLAVTRRFSQMLVDRYKVGVDFSIHQPAWNGDSRNFHAHIMMTTRELGEKGLGAKTRVLDHLVTGPKEITELRRTWATFGADSLDKAGHQMEATRFRESYKTLPEQRKAALARGDLEQAAALDREATQHVGVAATAMERAGELTERGDLNREITARNGERARLKVEQAKVEAQIIDLDAERAKRAEARAADSADKRAIRSEAQTLDPRPPS